MEGLSDEEIAARMQAQEEKWAHPSYDAEDEDQNRAQHIFGESILQELEGAEAGDDYYQLTLLGEIAGRISRELMKVSS